MRALVAQEPSNQVFTENYQLLVTDYQWSIIRDCLSLTDYQWPIIGDRISVTDYQRSIVCDCDLSLTDSRWPIIGDRSSATDYRRTIIGNPEQSLGNWVVLGYNNKRLILFRLPNLFTNFNWDICTDWRLKKHVCIIMLWLLYGESS